MNITDLKSQLQQNYTMVKLTYARVSDYAKSKNCSLIMTEKQFNEQKIHSKSVIEILSSCGHLSTTTFNNLYHIGCGITCKLCNYDRVGKQLQALNTNSETRSVSTQQEHDCFLMLQTIIQNSMDVIQLGEGTLADFIVKPKVELNNEWLPVQLKTTSRKEDDRYVYKFKINNHYDMPIILFAFNDMKIWILDGSTLKVKYIGIGKKRSVYNKYLVDVSMLTDTLTKLYYTKNYNNTIEYFDIPISDNTKTEKKYQIIRQEKLPFLDFARPDCVGQLFDFLVGTKKFQEKVASRDKRNVERFVVMLKCRSGSYKVGDNDFYWINIPNERHFYVIPESVLIENGLVGNTKQNNCMLLYPTYNIEKMKVAKVKHTWVKTYLFDYSNIDVLKIKEILQMNIDAII